MLVLHCPRSQSWWWLKFVFMPLSMVESLKCEGRSLSNSEQTWNVFLRLCLSEPEVVEHLKFEWMCIWTQANRAVRVMSNYLSWGETLSSSALNPTRMCEKPLWNMEKMKSAPCMCFCPLSIITAPPTGSQAGFGQTAPVRHVLGAPGDALRFPLHPPERSLG